MVATTKRNHAAFRHKNLESCDPVHERLLHPRFSAATSIASPLRPLHEGDVLLIGKGEKRTFNIDLL